MKTKSKVNQAGVYTKPTMRKALFEKIKAGSSGGDAGEWSARKAQMLAKEYKAKGGGYKTRARLQRIIYLMVRSIKVMFTKLVRL